MKKKVAKAEEVHTIGVRFINRPHNIWTYKVPKRAKVYLGQLLVVSNASGISIVVVVEIHDGVQYNERETQSPLKEITQKVSKL